jgi:hypothetical protein
MDSKTFAKPQGDRRAFIGGSDARIIMGNDDTALIRLWREKRGEVERTAAAACQGCQDRRHDLIQCLGGIRWQLLPLEHEKTKAELKALTPASGNG